MKDKNITMETQDEKAYKAFWCLYNKASDNRNDYVLNNYENTTVQINQKLEENKFRFIAKIKVKTLSQSHRVKRKFFFGHKTVYSEYEAVEGMVTNVERNHTFWFSIRDPKIVAEAKLMIAEACRIITQESIKRLHENQIRTEADRLLALEEMQCK